MDKVPPAIVKKLMRVFTLDSIWLQKLIREEHMSGPTGATTLSVKTGALRASVVPLKTEIVGDSVQAGVAIGGDTLSGKGTPAGRYVRVHVGPKGQITVIKPKKGMYLTIPFAQDYISKSGKVIKAPAVITKRTSRKFVTFRKVKQVSVPSRIHPEEITEAFSLKVLGDLSNIGINVLSEG
jgi:hypothetical protein